MITFASPIAAGAAGIECDKAKSSVEKLICSDHWLSDTDANMSAIYSALISESSSSVAGEIQRSQRHWIAHVRDKCTEVLCLHDVYRDRRWELAQRMKNFDIDCDGYARTTPEMDECGALNLNKLNKQLQATYKVLLRALESPDCCDSMDHMDARALAIKAQDLWLQFREAECNGHYETISAGTLRGGYYFNCAIALTKERIEQLLDWGIVHIKQSEITEAMNEPLPTKRNAP
ncbi:DUF1311 domain-containing protein [Curvibacter sp. CHRR-16]|uniref:lysozyme inhibitor LprI family protein n=1 Tax=Curvibacter sp. CHRR-16 TaxID=2835872 RepID=UPI001BDA0A88|nr:lysozyme inhibitor LprI family protein [Curvibacter sp. CHRR-16]MBT0569921.1 DUF1311 domain-containing protein [Curvibacter sp. CHRR-16]